MSFNNISREQHQKIIAQLDQALYNHTQWHNALVRTLICRLPSDKHDVNPEAYKECRFGQWYYECPDAELQDHPGFLAIGEQHKRMHQLATILFISSNSGNPILSDDYDNFANVLERMRLEIFTLKRELENYLYNRDPLTGAITRVNIMPILREQQELVKRQGETCCIVMLDIDLFKKVNDQNGHPAGDKVLASLSHYIIEHVRSYDKVFRYGGEEFFICIPHCELTIAQQMVEKLREGIAALPIDVGTTEPVHISVSFGLTVLEAKIPVEQSIDRVDKALYAAKAAGRNCTKIWDSSMQ